MTLSLPTSQNKETFKNYLRTYKDRFSSPILSARFEEVSAMMLSYASGITSETNVDVALFDNAGTITIGVGTDEATGNNLIYLPGLENDFVDLQVGSASTTINFTSTNITIGGTSYGVGNGFLLGNKFITVKGLGGVLLEPADPPIPPIYSLSQSTTTVNEGGSVQFTLNTVNVGDGTALYYSTGGSMEAADFSDNSLTGSFNIVGTGATTGVATVTRTIANDINTESTESFTFVVRTGSTSGPVVATSDSVNVIDVVPSYSVVPSTTSTNEGSSVTFTVTTTGVPNSTILYWTLLPISGTLSASDFNDAALNGSFTVNNNTATIIRSIVADRSTEGLESFQIEIRRSSITGTIIATSETVYINDTSLNVGQSANGLTFGPVQVNRDNGNAALASDWYTICGIDNLPDDSKIALFIDNSGSMTTTTVQASYNLLVSKLAEKNITIITVENGNEDWITPFLTDLS